jgi:hypothetical protein
MATPEIRATEPDQSFTPNLELATAEEAANLTLDCAAMPLEEYQIYVHWTAMSGDVKGTSLTDLLSIDAALYDQHREAAREMAGLTVTVTNLQSELGLSNVNQAVISDMTAATFKIHGLYAEIENIRLRRAWIKGYIEDRRPISS